jgi:RimJ/RimL family protein N-acetyltransferase
MNAENKPIIHFEKVGAQHQKLIFEWLAEPHMREFWDNSQEHKDDIINFIEGRKTPSHYFNGVFSYWIGSIDNTPYCFILTSDLPELKPEKTVSLDFGIGNPVFIGKGLAAPTLKQFTLFYQREIDPKVGAFFIDPEQGNHRAKHVYEKAGFKVIGEHVMTKGAFIGQTLDAMILKMATKL